MQIITSKQAYFLIGLFLVTLFIFNWNLGLWDQDEAAYAGFAMRMNESGNYLIPDFTWSGIHRKPPLHFWFNAFWFKVFGAGEWATRFSSALSVIGSIILIWKWGGKVFGEKIGKIAAIVALSSVYAIFLVKISVTDADLMFFETLTALSILCYLKLKNWKYLIGLIIGCAGGALVKGPPVYILAVGMLGILFLFKQYRIKALVAGLASLIGLLPLYLWGAATWEIDGGEFVKWLVDWYVLKRDKPFASQTGPPGYFMIFFLLTFFAFAGFILTEFKNTIQTIWKKEKQSDYLFLLAWIAPGWLFYEIMPSKLPTYAIACFGAVSLMIAKGWIESNKKPNYKALKGIGFGLGTILGFGLIAGGLLLLKGTLLILCILGGITIIYLTYYNYKKSSEGHSILFTSALQISLFSLIAVAIILPGIENKRSAGKLMVENVIDWHKPSENTPVQLTHQLNLPSVIFYLEKEDVTYNLNYKPNTYMDHFMNFEQMVYVSFPGKKENWLDTLISNTSEPMEIDTISGWQYDRGRTIDYFIVRRLY